MYLLTASYLASAGVVVYVEFRGPEKTGVELASLLAEVRSRLADETRGRFINR